jgi:hypothetical protein
MSKNSLYWQKESFAKSRESIETYDLGAAARYASKQGRVLTADEFEGFLFDRRTYLMPRKRLLFDGERYTYQ